jgi:NADH-quinone oxidoreductase subunit N
MVTPISIDIASLNLGSLVPMLVAIVGALVILCLDLIVKNLEKQLFVVLTILFLLIDLGTLIGYSGPARGFFDLMLVDGIAILAQIIIVVGTASFVFLALTNQDIHEFKYPEYFAMFLFMTAGFQFMVASDNLILIFVGLETASLALYTMIAMHNTDKSIEASVKYFTMGALAAAFYAFGAMILYYTTGTVELELMAQHFANTNFENYSLILLGVVFMIAAIGFKLSLVPFHIWAPDVYEGSSAAMAGFIAVIPKIAILVVAVRFFAVFVSVDDAWVQGILWAMAVITMTLPNMIALVQSDVKRMLAYSSISHAGFVLVAIMLGTSQALEALFFYWILFGIVILAAFTMLWIHRTKEKPVNYGFKTNYDFGKYTGLVKSAPTSAFIIGILMFALAGVPPFSVFWGKMYLISATINSGEIILALIMALNSAIAAFYYLKLVVFMFLKQNDGQNIEIVYANSLALRILVGIAVFLTMTSILWAGWVLEMVSVAVQSSGF